MGRNASNAINSLTVTNPIASSFQCFDDYARCRHAGCAALLGGRFINVTMAIVQQYDVSGLYRFEYLVRDQARIGFLPVGPVAVHQYRGHAQFIQRYFQARSLQSIRRAKQHGALTQEILDKIAGAHQLLAHGRLAQRQHWPVGITVVANFVPGPRDRLH